MEYTKIYRDLQPVLNKKLRRRRLYCVIWGLLAMVLFFFGGWFFAIVPFVILITDFVFKNNINHKALTLVRGRVLNKIAQNHAPIVSDPSDHACMSKFCLEIDIHEANFLSCFGKVKNNNVLRGSKKIKVGENLFESFECDTEVTLVVLSNKKCVAYVLNGEVLVAY
jgi:hypothetical protein